MDRRTTGGDARGFWRDLDDLRRQQGVSYKRLARHTNVPHSTLQHWMTKRSGLAPWTDVRPVVAALGGSEADWLRRWKRADAPAEEPASLVASPSAPHVPQVMIAQALLPMDIMEFTGRRDEVRLLLDLLADKSGTAVAIAAIEGMAGVGKTRLAVHVAHHLLARRRGDQIQLYVDLQGHNPTRRPADPAAVLEELLRLLGVPGERIPHGLTERTMLYRAQLHEKRGIVLLDDVANEEQIRPLLPGSPSCIVITTSRRKLIGLDGTRPVTLSVLDRDDAVALLAEIIGEQRVRDEPRAAGAIADHCGYLPLAVALAARRLRARPAWSLADLAERLGTASRLSEFSVRDRAVAAAFAVSYDHLPLSQRRLFRLVALHPGTDFSATSVAALACTTPEESAVLLEALLDEHLLEQTTCDRYRFHNLVHVFARDRVMAEETAEHRRLAIGRLLAWFVHTAERADRELVRHRRRLPLPPAQAPTPPLIFSGYRDALRWFITERSNLISAVDCAVAHDFHEEAWRIPAFMYGFFVLRKHWGDWIKTHHSALTACERLGDDAGKAWILNGLGIAYAECQRADEALDCFHRSLAISRTLKDSVSHAQVLNNIGETYRRTKRFSQAIEHYNQDLTICRAVADRHGEAVSLNNMGKVLSATRRFDEALGHHRNALRICDELGDQHGSAETLNDLGEAYRGRGESEVAIKHLERALTLRVHLGDVHGEAETLCNLGKTHQDRGDADAAARHYHRAAALWRQVGDQNSEQTARSRLESLTHNQLSDETEPPPELL